MAEDWIKMRMGLQNHPKTVRMSSALSTDKFRIVGGLHAAWCLFDTYSEDGRLPGYTPKALGEAIGWPGFEIAMVAVEWLVVTPEGLQMPRFDIHNGESARKRALDAERKRVARMSADEADKERTDRGLEEDKSKRRKSKSQKLSSGDAGPFDQFWEAYPDRTAKKSVKAKWIRCKLDEHIAAILTDVAARKRLDKRWVSGFIPLPMTYLNQERWRDGINPHQLIATPANGAAVGASPKAADDAAARIAGAESWARDMLELGSIDAAEAAAHVAQVRAKYAPKDTHVS